MCQKMIDLAEYNAFSLGKKFRINLGALGGSSAKIQLLISNFYFVSQDWSSVAYFEARARENDRSSMP